jgi:hypothetical protein
MRTRTSVTLLAVAVAATALAVACGGDKSQPTAPVAETFSASLNGANERPAAHTTPATAAAEFTLRSDTLRWDIAMANMSNVFAAHIHIGDANTAAGILLPLTPGTSGTNSSRLQGFVTRSTYVAPAAPNAGVTFDSLLVLMRNGNSYVIVHTNNTANDPSNNSGPGDFPAGEIRGQIAPHG